MLDIYIYMFDIVGETFIFSCLSVGFYGVSRTIKCCTAVSFAPKKRPGLGSPPRRGQNHCSFVQSATLSARITIDKHSTKKTQPTKTWTFTHWHNPWHTLTPLKKNMTFAEMFRVRGLGATHLAGHEIVLVEAPMRPGCQEKRFIG